MIITSLYINNKLFISSVNIYLKHYLYIVHLIKFISFEGPITLQYFKKNILYNNHIKNPYILCGFLTSNAKSVCEGLG